MTKQSQFRVCRTRTTLRQTNCLKLKAARRARLSVNDNLSRL